VVADTAFGGGVIAPALAVIDGEGTLIDEGVGEVACTHASCQDSTCPFAQGACGIGKTHSVAVYSHLFTGCTGGGYQITVNVFDRLGRPLGDSEIDLGGGPKRRVPGWAIDRGAETTGPLLDDARLPRGF
jgi:hypothetical protein